MVAEEGPGTEPLLSQRAVLVLLTAAFLGTIVGVLTFLSMANGADALCGDHQQKAPIACRSGSIHVTAGRPAASARRMASTSRCVSRSFTADDLAALPPPRIAPRGAARALFATTRFNRL
jgi:hypothetical protein